MKLTVKKVGKIIGVLVSCLLFSLIALLLVFYWRFEPEERFSWGVTFSPIYAEELGLNWKTAYEAMLTELKPKKIRLMAYWQWLEPERGVFNFEDIDYQIKRAGDAGAEIILVIGRKQPRWPECHEPSWYKQLPVNEKEDANFAMLREVVNHYKPFSQIKIWQIENEPLFNFGPNCPKTSRTLLKQEVAMVKSMDSSRPILITDSGEFGRWLPAATVGGDIFGTTMYRVVHSPKYGYFSYPLPPLWFKLKGGMLAVFSPQPLIGIELQAEPWFADGPLNTPLTRHYELMNIDLFQEYLEYAKSTGIGTHYLWGVEWWYWLKTVQKDDIIWEKAKTLF